MVKWRGRHLSLNPPIRTSTPTGGRLRVQRRSLHGGFSVAPVDFVERLLEIFYKNFSKIHRIDLDTNSTCLKSLSESKNWLLDGDRLNSCQVIYSQFGLAIHQNDHQERRRFVEWAQNEIAVVPDFHKRILFSDQEHFWLNGYVNKQNCRIWSEAYPQVYVETPLHPEKLTVWCALWAGGILLQKR
ncbi:putative DD41D transposase [Trichonephila clavipes]|nr:putative DD41D transposase [Trichonephila clavipes]